VIENFFATAIRLTAHHRTPFHSKRASLQGWRSGQVKVHVIGHHQVEMTSLVDYDNDGWETFLHLLR